MKTPDRRQFVLATAALAVSMVALPGLSGLSPVMASAMRDIEQAMRLLDATQIAKDDYLKFHEASGMPNRDDSCEWYSGQPPTKAFYAAWDGAQRAVERAMTISPRSSQDEDAVMRVLDIYGDIAPSSFSLQCARDLFTPRRFQTCAPHIHERIRYWLLTDPEEDFEKTGMPRFLRALRAQAGGASSAPARYLL